MFTSSPITPGGHGSPGVDVDDLDPVGQRAQCTRRGVRCAAIATPPSVEPNPSMTMHAEPRREPVDVRGCTLVAVHRPQRVVGVVRTLGCGQHVRQRLADIVGVGGAVAAYVGQELRRRELAPQHHRAPACQRHRPADQHGVRVEQRHRHVADVVGPSPNRSVIVTPAIATLPWLQMHRLRVAAGARGEDQHEQVVGLGRREPHRCVAVRGYLGRPDRRVDVDVRRCRRRARPMPNRQAPAGNPHGRYRAASAAPRRIGFRPTGTIPDKPAATSSDEKNGVFCSSTPTCGGRAGSSRACSAAATAAPC